MLRLAGVGALALAALHCVGCTAPAPGDGGVLLPPEGGAFDYQLGGAYPPPPGVDIVARDRLEAPPDGVYAICYVNLFQTQPDAGGAADARVEGTTAWWEQEHPDLLLRDEGGAPVMDLEWNEALFDIRTAASREALSEIQSAWIEGCADAGYDAMEADNLDQHERSQGLQTLDDALAYMRVIIPLAHGRGLAVAQKNTAELGEAGPELGFDLAVAEECEVYDECDSYRYPSRVLEVEYTDTEDVTRDGVTRAAFEWACERRSGDHPITLRDRDLVPSGEDGYVFQRC
ncbi:endo alpha-1,4 polygalactosaminidase [Microbacterium oryzae]|uniref:endo alpha-1,4 polygalactosaminidase n=1 Tax=Microbacterium oryzae TaxID=743009 RepID=UPI0025B08C8C|nr:endo alpha-1,4 polygalactosaminidase [Microbacterium oryzae]MDN3311411.1 endo alpha-1,4 polygalactosaminidase [Microbacterium oryzae]